MCSGKRASSGIFHHFSGKPPYDNTTQLLYTTAYETVYYTLMVVAYTILTQHHDYMEHSLFPPFIVSHYVVVYENKSVLC